MPAGPVHHDAALHKVHEIGEGVCQGSIFQRSGGILRVLGGDGIGQGIAYLGLCLIHRLFSGKPGLAVLNLGAGVRDRDILAVISAQDSGIGKGLAVSGIFDDSGKAEFPTLARGNVPDIHGQQAGFHIEVVLSIFTVHQHAAINKP